jgi:hypothetical protein
MPVYPGALRIAGDSPDTAKVLRLLLEKTDRHAAFERQK